MHENLAKQRVCNLFDSAIEATKRSDKLKVLHRELRLARQRFDQPMRVAIVGMIKAGKSTTMNALLGETVVATGVIEATFNVNWLKYGSSASLIVHFKDNSPPESKSLEDLDRVTRRSQEHMDYLLRIKYIEVFYPNKILQTLNLIDTPGLASFYQKDSEATTDFLRLHGEQLTKTTQEETENADAVLYLFSHNMAESDTSNVELFQGPIIGQASPINSIGVLTKVDMYWPDRDNALAAGNEIISLMQKDHPKVRRLFYSMLPICGSLAWGAQTMTQEEFETLTQIAQLPEAAFQRILGDAERFATREYANIPILPSKREAVLDRLGLYGINHAYTILQSGTYTRQQLAEALLPHSGLTALKELILSHFGNRSFLIKLDSTLNQIDKACFWARQREDIQGTDREILRRIEREFEALKDQEQGFQELKMLRDYYQGKLLLTPKEEQQLLQVTGEFGTSNRKRLGLPDAEDEYNEVCLRETLATAKKNAAYWRRRAIDPGASREMESASGLLGDAYDHITYQTMEMLKKRGFAL